MIPQPYEKNFCNSAGIIDCIYYGKDGCPKTCSYALNMKREEEPVRIKSGIERFLNKFGVNYKTNIQ